MPNLGFTFFHLASFSLGFPKPEGHIILAPLGQCSSECWSEMGSLQAGFTRSLTYLSVP